MTPFLLVGPAVEPVPVAEMKSHLRLDHDADDALLGMLIEAARCAAEAHAGRLMISQTWRLALDRWPAGGVVRVPLAPFAGLVAARVLPQSGAAANLPLSDFVTDTVAEPGRIAVRGAPPAPGRRFAGVELDVAVGYGAAPGDVPEPLRQAVRLLAAHWYENRGDELPERTDALPPQVAALLNPFRRARLA